MRKMACRLLVALLVFAVTMVQIPVSQGKLFLFAECAIEGSAAHAAVGAVGLAAGALIETAGILLMVNPWLVLGVGLAYGA